MGSRATPLPSAWRTIPPAVRALLDRLLANGHEAVLVGGCVRDLLRGVGVGDFDVATAASPEAVCAIFPRAIPVGLPHGTVMVPTAAGPVDVTTFRAGPRLEDDLAHRDFTVNAMAWDPVTDQLVDRHGGLADLRARRLRAVGDADTRLAEDPLRALRAARLVATLGLEPDPSLEPALARAAPALAKVAPERIRHELEALLLAPNVGAALELLRRSGLERQVVGGQPSAGAAAVVARLPVELPIRLAGWLRGCDPARVLERLRFPRRTVREVARLGSHHPVDRGGAPLGPVAVRRLLRRTGAERIDALLTLREAELAVTPDAPASERVAALREAVETARRSGSLALRRRDLALDGRSVMEILGCGPGPQVGRALDFLTERMIRDPACNTPDGLREHLEAWRREAGCETGGRNAP